MTTATKTKSCPSCRGSREVQSNDGDPVICMCSARCSKCEQVVPIGEVYSVRDAWFCDACVEQARRDVSEVAGIDATDDDALDALIAQRERPRTLVLPSYPEVL